MESSRAMKPIFNTPEPNITSGWAGSMHLIQMIVLTIDGRQVVCLGPVLHVPSAGVHVGEVQNIEFGEVIPAQMAAHLVGGGFSQSMGVQ